ncbi:MAG: glycosyltransferase, partial [Bacillota bacterium]
MNKPILSVIVPIYNTEKFLKACIDSILKQSYKNLEIILVNDCS